MAATLKEVVTMLDATKFRAMMDEVIVFLSEWLERHLKIVYGNINWNAHIYSMLSPDQQKFVTESGANSLDRLDLSALISVFVGNFVVLRKKFQLDADLKSMALTAKTLRNADSHRTAKDIKTLTEDKLQYRLLSLKTLLVGLGADESVVRKIAFVTTESDDACVGKPKAASNPLPSTVINRSGITIKVSSAVPRQVANMPLPQSNVHSTTCKKMPIVEHCPQAKVESCRNNINFARSMYEEYFKSDAIILDGKKRLESPIKGRGEWEFLVVMPFVGEGNKALNAANSSWHCPDTEPYVQDGHIVWEFPPCTENVAPVTSLDGGIYPAGFVPSCFDVFIANHPGTDYSPDCGRVENNLNAKPHDANWYLGNYFPRSFVETFCIYDYIFSFGFDAVRGNKSELTICDVGVGSGGATYGLIWALRKRLFGDDTFKKIRVIGLDGNQNALDIFMDLKSVIEGEWPIEFEYVTDRVRFTSASIIPMDKVACKADFVITSKCLQELGHARQDIQALYERYFSEAQSIVSDDGLISVLEIDNLNRSTALENALRSLNDGRVVIAPRCDEGGLVGFERIDLYSTRIKSVVGENVLFTVVGPSSFAERIPRWIPAARPALNVQDVDSEPEESSRERE